MNITELDEYMKTEESRKNGIRKDSISKIKKQIASLNEDFSKSASDKREKELKDAGKI